MNWDQGRTVIDRMLADSELQRLPASREQADRLIDQAVAHLSSAAHICDQDPPGGYALLYDAARKALAAVPENQGLRPITRGGHLASTKRSGPGSTRRWGRSCSPSTECAASGTMPNIRRQTSPR